MIFEAIKIFIIVSNTNTYFYPKGIYMANLVKLKQAFFLVFIGLTIGCSPYQKLLKSQDYNQWYEQGLIYYQKEDFMRASTLLGQLVSIYRGTDKAENVIFTYAKSLYGMSDYTMAGHYFREYVKTYPTGNHAEECQFMSAFCYYKLSPKPRLDQSDTEAAINEFQLFINLYPNSARVEEATKLMDKMSDKLVYKSYLNARLYFDLGNYMGNNYQSAVIAAQNSLKEFPDTKYREELSFLILEAKYIQATYSIEEKKEERYRDTVDEYYSFFNEFPESKNILKAQKYFQDAQRLINKLEQVPAN